MRSRQCLVVFTRDLRIHDNPVLNYAIENYDHVIPLFVLKDTLPTSPLASGNRIAYLCECLADLRSSLQNVGADLIVRHGDWMEEVLSFVDDVDAIAWAREVSSYGQERDSELIEKLKSTACQAHCLHSHTVVAPDDLSPASATSPREFKVFTPYYRRWLEVPLLPIVPPPHNVPFDSDKYPLSEDGEIPKASEIVDVGFSPQRQSGGETSARKALNKWVREDLANYEIFHDDLAADKTSHIGSALHCGTVSAHELVVKLRHKNGAAPFIRQLCWRDFYHQILFYNPSASWSDYVDRGDQWNTNDDAFEKWCAGQTGYPLVDAAMRQLTQEGFMHNRARMVVASFLTKDLYIDWKRGAKWFMTWLTDGDLANNNLNWQWTAGTGTDTNPHRIFNPIRQSERFDPEGIYIKRYVPELKDVPSKDIHFPHHLRDHLDTAHLLGDYPLPIVDHAAAIAEYKEFKKINNP